MAYSTYIQNFVDRVAAYANRDASSFLTKTNSVDLILASINNARSLAQQSYDFGQQKTIGAIRLNGSSGAPWAYPSGNYGPYTSDAGTGTTGALRLKSIDMLFNYTTDTSGNMQPTNKIPFDNSRWFTRLLPTNLGFPFTQVYPQVYPPFYYNTIPTQQMFAYVVGPNIYVNTCNQPSWFMFFGQQKLADLTGAETADFFIDNYPFWLTLACLQDLNNYLKEDQRVSISAALVNDAYNKMCFDDAKKEYQGVEWTSLD